jgi:hypothetical protein
MDVPCRRGRRPRSLARRKGVLPNALSSAATKRRINQAQSASSGRCARPRASNSAARRRRAARKPDAHKPDGVQRPRHAVPHIPRDNDQPRKQPRWPPRPGRRAGRGPAGQKQSLSSIFLPRLSSHGCPAGTAPACQVKRARDRRTEPTLLTFRWTWPAPLCSHR